MIKLKHSSSFSGFSVYPVLENWNTRLVAGGDQTIPMQPASVTCNDFGWLLTHRQRFQYITGIVSIERLEIAKYVDSRNRQ